MLGSWRKAVTDRKRPLTVVVSLLMILAACSTDGPADQPAEAATTEDGTTGDSTTGDSTVEGNTIEGSTVEGSGNGQDGRSTPSSTVSDQEAAPTVEPTTATAFRLFILEADDVPPDVITFAGATTDAELNGLATTACRLVEPDMSQAELGTVSLSMHGDSAPDDLTDSEFSLVFGALAGLQCPERLPIADRAADLPPPAEGSGAFRAGLDGLWTAEHPVRRFVDNTPDERLELLRISACAFATEELGISEFGLVALDHYDRELTDEERGQIGSGDYAEVFGAVVGWFCPERLPTIG